MNIGSKPLCASWNSGNAYMGLQNAAGTIAYTVPGYNGGAWTANNISWSFIPVGNHNLSTTSNSITQGIYWVDSFSNNVIGFGDTLNYWPPSDTTIYVFYGDTALLNDPCFMGGMDTCINVCGKGFTCNSPNPYIRLHVIQPHAAFTYNMNSTCVGAIVQFFNNSQNASSYYWDFGDGSFDTQPSPTHTYFGTGPFTVTLVATGLGCSDTMTALIVPTISPVIASFTLSTDSVCAGSAPVTSNNTSIGTNLSYNWIMGDGTIYNSTNISHVYASNGNYTVKLIIVDTVNGCIDSTTQNIFVDDSTQARFTLSPLSICVGQTVYL
jgi:PKD repeat protein